MSHGKDLFLNKVIARKNKGLQAIKRVREIAQELDIIEIPLKFDLMITFLENSDIHRVAAELAPIAHLAEDLRLMNARMLHLDEEGRAKFLDYVKAVGEASIDMYQAITCLCALERRREDYVLPEGFIEATPLDYSSHESAKSRIEYVRKQATEAGFPIVPSQDLFTSWVQRLPDPAESQEQDPQFDPSVRWSAYAHPQGSQEPLQSDQHENTEC